MSDKINTAEEKAAQSEEIRRQTKEYLKRGGVIKTVTAEDNQGANAGKKRTVNEVKKIRNRRDTNEIENAIARRAQKKKR